MKYVLAVLLLFVAGSVKAQTVQFENADGVRMDAGCGGFAVDGGGSICIYDRAPSGGFWFTLYDAEGDIVLHSTFVATHQPTLAEPWLAFTYDGGSGSVVGVWRQFHSKVGGGWLFYGTAGSLTRD